MRLIRLYVPHAPVILLLMLHADLPKVQIALRCLLGRTLEILLLANERRHESPRSKARVRGSHTSLGT